MALILGEGAAETGAATGDHRCVKTEDQAVAAGHSVDRARWQESFEGLMQRIAGRFARVEPEGRVQWNRNQILIRGSRGPARARS
jgi:hypothetical protein